MSLLRLSSAAQREPARVAQSRAGEINCARAFHCRTMLPNNLAGAKLKRFENSLAGGLCALNRYAGCL
jgi:hypothetical protein